MITPLLQRILFATDFSDDALRAQEYAMYLATAWDATIDVLHVIESPSSSGCEADSIVVMERARDEAGRRLEQVRDYMARSGLEVVVRQIVGDPQVHICLAAREREVDLVVLGVQGRTNRLYGLIGAITERVVKEGPCPVLAVPGLRAEVDKPIDTTPHVPIRNILAPLDFSAPSLDAVEYAVQIADGLGAKVTLMHVLEPVCYDLDCGLGMIEQEAHKRDHWNRHLLELKEVITSRGLPAEVEISGGIPSEAILASVLRHHADLIVMGTHGRRASPERPFGSVAEAVLRRSTCPVLTVKAPKFSANHCRVLPQAMSKVEIKGVQP